MGRLETFRDRCGSLGVVEGRWESFGGHWSSLQVVGRHYWLLWLIGGRCGSLGVVVGRLETFGAHWGLLEYIWGRFGSLGVIGGHWKSCHHIDTPHSNTKLRYN